jgi:hypothetical protein
MIDPRARQVLEDDLIKFLRETHKAGSAYHRPGPHDPTVYINLFSFTHVDGVVYRHLSVSVPGGLYPNPIAALMLADLFGFTGWDGSGVFPESWTCRRVEEPVPCIAILEPVRMTVPAKERN